MRSIINTFNNLRLNKIVCFRAGRNVKTSSETGILTEFSQIDPSKKQTETVTNGRSWRAEELRLKSNSDLHKLWYVCVKQKNILLADKIVNKKITNKDLSKYRMIKLRKTMKRILSVVGQREKIRAQYRRQLEDQYISKKKKQLQERMMKQPPKLPQITPHMLRQKYHQLRKGVDNVQYLQKIWQKQQNYQKKREIMQKRLAQPQTNFQSYFEKQLTFEEKPMQQQILRSHIKNWKMLNFKQRKIILGFLNARRAKDAKSAFLKQLQILSQKVAHQQLSNRIKAV